MSKCCGGASCACVLEEGTHLNISGSGTSSDPFVIDADVVLQISDNTVFDLTLAGAGTGASPWVLSVAFASTAKLDDLPDVNAPSPTNAQVLGWDSATSKWTARAPTTAASGSVTHDTSLSGDGSGGSPLLVVTDETYHVTTRSSGVGLDDAGMRQIVRRYATAAARTSDTSPAPALNSLSILDDSPGVVWYWTGSAWAQLADSFDITFIGSQFLNLSGPYTGTQRLKKIIKNLATTTDTLGQFDVLTAADLSGRAGVLSCLVTPTDLGSPQTAAWAPVLFPNVSKVSATAYRQDDGTPWAGVSVSGLVEAWAY